MHLIPYDAAPRLRRSKRVIRSAGVVWDCLESRWLLSAGYTYQQLASFDPSASAGSAPAGQMAIDKSGDLYGFTTSGGANGTGAAYEVQQGNSSPILLASFPAAGGTNFVATGPALDSAGDLYGVTEAGGANGNGTVFEIVAGSNSLTTIAAFNSATAGSSPGGTLAIDSLGDLFGTAANGGANGCGTVWELPKGATAISTLASFTPINVAGVNQNPGANGIAIDAHGNLFGTTGGNAAAGSDGTVWELPAGGTAIQTLTIFSGSNGATPVGGLAIDSNDNLFGVTQFGGDNIGQSDTPQGTGVAWEVPSNNGQIVVLNNFDTMSGGESPIGGVTLDSKGDLFGTTSIGGNDSGGDGTFWEINTQTGSGGDLVLFSGNNGSTPRGNLVSDSLGNIYGTTSAGGTSGAGTVFKMDYAGASASAAALSPSVIKTNLPPSIVAGIRAPRGVATVDLSNSTSVAVRGAFTISLYASADGTIDSSAARVGSITRSVQVPANGTTAVSVPVGSFPTASQGTYTLLAHVSDAAGDVSNGTAGTTVTVAPAFIALSEGVGRVTLPLNLVSGGKAKGQVLLKIANGGNVTASGNVQITLGFTPPGGGSLAQLAAVTRRLVVPAGKSQLVAVPVSLIPSGLDGSYVLVAQVIDPNGAASTASSSATYDISPPTVTLKAAINSFRPTNIVAGSLAGGSVSLTIRNEGNIPVGSITAAGGFNIDVSLTSSDGTQTVSLGSFTRPIVLNPGQSRTLAITLSSSAFASIVAGTYVPNLVASVGGTSYSASATGSQMITVA